MADLQKAVFHGVAAAVMNYGYKSTNNLFLAIQVPQYGGQAQFLTIQGLLLAWLTMVFSLASDAFPSYEKIRSVKRYLLIMALPLSVVISSIYWTLILFFPNLIIQAMESEPTASPDAFAAFRLPLMVDLSLHAVPAVAMLLDFFLYETKYSKKEMQFGVPIALFSYAAVYGFWVEHCAKHNEGIFPYPFLTQNTLPVRIGIYFGSTGFGAFAFRLFNGLHS